MTKYLEKLFLHHNVISYLHTLAMNSSAALGASSSIGSFILSSRLIGLTLDTIPETCSTALRRYRYANDNSNIAAPPANNPTKRAVEKSGSSSSATGTPLKVEFCGGFDTAGVGGIGGGDGGGGSRRSSTVVDTDVKDVIPAVRRVCSKSPVLSAADTSIKVTALDDSTNTE